MTEEEKQKLQQEALDRYKLSPAIPSSAATARPPSIKPAPSSLEDVKPIATTRGVTGAVIRGAAVPAFQSLGGAIIGSAGGTAGARLGASAGPILFGLGDLAVEGVNSYFGTDFETSRGAVTKLLDSIGTPKPDTAAERIIEAVTEGVASAGAPATIKYGQKAIEKIVPSLAPKVKSAEQVAGETAKIVAQPSKTRIEKAAQFMEERPLEQLVIGGVSAGVGAGAEELGAGPVAAPLVGIGAGLAIPGARAGFRAVRPSQPMKEKMALERLQGVYQKIIPNEVERKQIVQQLQQAGKAADQDVQLMTGDITGNDAILALQRALESSSQKVAEMRTKNIAGVSRRLGKGLEQAGAKPEETARFFENELNILKQVKDDAEESLRFAGTDISEEFKSAKKAVDDAESAYQRGLITSQEAHQRAKSALDDYFEIENKKVSDRKMGELSTETSDIFEKQGKIASDYATSLYTQIPDVKPFVQPNTKNAIDKIIAETPKGKGGRQGIHPTIEDIYANIVDENGNLISKTLNDPVKLRQRLNDDINIAIRSGKKQQARELQIVKEAIDADLKSLETAYPQIKRANKFYSEYSNIFQSKLAEDVFKEGQNLTQFLDKFGKSEEGLTNLRNSILNHPEVANTEAARRFKNEGLFSVGKWVVSKANQAMRKPVGDKKYTSTSLKKWLNQGEGSVIFKVFKDELKDSRSEIEELISKFEDLENSAIQAKKNVDLAKAQALTEGSPVRVALQDAEQSKKLIDKSLDDSRRQLAKEFEERTNEALNPANRFLGGRDASTVIGGIISNSETAVRDMTSLVEAASKDPTGKALEGLRNAGKSWLNREFRVTGKPTTTKGMAGPVLLIDNLQTNLSRAQQLLAKGTPERNAIEILLGKDSKDMAVLDQARETIDMMNRQTSLTASNLLGQDVKPNEILDALVTVGAIQVGQVKGFVVWKLIETMRKLGRVSENEIKDLFEQVLAKSLYDPQTADVAFQPLTKEKWPAVKRLAKNIGITARATDFGLEEEQEKEQIQEE